MKPLSSVRDRSAVALGDGIEGLGSVSGAALVLTDLPSGETQAQFDRAPNLLAFWKAAWGALRDDGAIVAMASNIRFASMLVASQPKTFRYDLIWHKSLRTGFLNARRKPLRAHEFILVFCRSAPPYTVQLESGHPPIHNFGPGRSLGENYGANGVLKRNRGGATDRFPSSVLKFPSVGTSDRRRSHPQQKPVDLLRWLIRSYSKPGDLVLDPFAGSGSTGEAAHEEGRRFLGWDHNPRFGRAGAA